MKKYIAITGFLFFALVLNAQNKIISGFGAAGANFLTGATNCGFATHKLLHSAAKIAAYDYTFQINATNPYYIAYSTHLRDYEAGTANTAAIVLKGSLDNIQYLPIDSVAYSSVADSLKCIKGSAGFYVINGGMQFKPPMAYKFLRVTITPAGDSIWVKSIWLNVLPIK